MGRIVQRVTILAAAMAMVPFLADLHLPFTFLDPGIAFAKGGGGGGGADHGGGGAHGGEHGGVDSDPGGSGSAFGDHWADHQGRSAERGVADNHSSPSATRSSDDRNRMNRGRAGEHTIHRAENREEARENSQSPRSVGNAVSKAATSTAHAGKAAANASGFRNLGQAVSSAVHTAQDSTRVSDR